MFRYVFYISTFLVFVDFFLNIIWLPIGVSKTYGFRTGHEAFMDTYNGTGAIPGWNWCLSYLATAGVLIGFDASGHVSEETKNAQVNAAKGIFWSTVVSGVLGFATMILFLFTTVRLLGSLWTMLTVKPDLNTLFAYNAPQPFVMLYADSLGRGGHIVMNIVSIVALWFVSIARAVQYQEPNNGQNTTVGIVAASRLVFAVARDGVLPFSGWVSQVSAEGQPRNAVLVVWGVGALVSCTILPSAVAFTSLVSISGVPSAAAYGLIALGRLTVTANKPLRARWSLGRWSKPMQVVTVIWNTFVVAVLFSPYQWPVTGSTLNCGWPVVFVLLSN